MILYVWCWIRQDNTSLILLGHLVNCMKQSIKYTLLPLLPYPTYTKNWSICEQEIIPVMMK